MKSKIRLSNYYFSTDKMKDYTIENGINSDTVNFVRNSLIAMRGPEFAEEHIDAILDIMNSTTHSLREVLSIYDIVHTVNPYEIDAEVCRLKGLDYAQKHAREVSQMIREGCPSVEEAVKIIDQADSMPEIRERMQAIYDHLDAINEILQAAETVDETRNVIDDTCDFIDEEDFI